jgi:hypothetical protein
MRFSFSFSFSNSSNLSSPSPSSIPPPPPPSPNDSLLDISPRKSSFSSASSRDTSCAFPSWPNRSSLLAEAEQSASSYISDEDLFPSSSPASPPSSCTAWSTPMSGSLEDEIPSSTMHPVLGAPDLTTEEQIQMMREAAEEEDRRTQYLAHAQAHARAQQALRVAQLQQQTGMRRKKGRVVPDKKRRSTSSSSSGSKSTARATTTKKGMD